jgi:hypothetical protein
MRWKRLGRGLLFGLAGFLLSTGLSYVLVLQLYTHHDRELAAAMVSFFFFGPIGGGHRPGDRAAGVTPGPRSGRHRLHHRHR